MTEKNNYSILIVDDENQNIELLNDILVDDGYDVIQARSGEEAWLILETTEKLIKVILLDRMMPGISGTELLKKIRLDRRFKDKQVILQSAMAMATDIACGTDAGANKYITKPIDEKILLSMLRSCVKDYDQLNSISSENALLKDKVGILGGFLKILDEQSHDISPMSLISKLRVNMREVMKIKGDPKIELVGKSDKEGTKREDDQWSICYPPFIARIDGNSTEDQKDNVLQMLVIMSKHIELKTQEQLSARYQRQLKAVIDTTGHNSLSLIREIDEAKEEMTKEQLLQKMKLNLFEILVAAGHTEMKGDLERLKMGSMSDQEQAESQESIDKLMTQFGL
ncbi:MAG: response regulator [Deltaproteobacteria bacterium]|nr:response regulator [Deltaproteobacteria bacterium]